MIISAVNKHIHLHVPKSKHSKIKRQPEDYGGEPADQRLLVRQNKRNVNRMTVAAIPLASAISFDKIKETSTG